MSHLDPLARNRAEFEREEHRNVFMIMRLAPEPPLLDIQKAIKATLERYGLRGILATDVRLADELWAHIRFCMEHSRYAIVVFDKLLEPDFNPNVAIELGYMLALQRHCLILKYKQHKTLFSDMIGHLFKPFDTHKAVETVSAAVTQWLHELRYTPVGSAETITADNPLEANKRRTRRIISSLSSAERIVRQAASLSSLAIADNEQHDDDEDCEFQELLEEERNRFVELLKKGKTIRAIICPAVQVERVELKLASREFAMRNILPRYDQLIQFLENHQNDPHLQIVFTLRLPHDNALIVDETALFVGRKRRRERGFPYTTVMFDPTAAIDEYDMGCIGLKQRVLRKLKETRATIVDILER